MVPYNPILLSALEIEHKALMAKFLNILDHAKKKQFQLLNQTLKEFSTLMSNHFRAERELYMYLEHVVSNGDKRYYSVRAEMRDIALSINSKINSYTNVPVCKQTLRVFKKDFALIGKMLVGRMRHEEKHLFIDYSTHTAS